MLWLILALGVLVFAGGCVPTTAQIQTLSGDVDKLMLTIDNYQEKFAEEVDRVQEDIVVVNEAVKEKADQGIVESLIDVNEATAPVNPYYPLIASILYGLNELRKRKGYEKGVARLESEAPPEEAKKIHDTVKHYTKRLIP